jgi:prevent-host-death family protein
MLYKTYELYVGDMSTPDISFRPQQLPVEVTVSHARAHLPELLEGLRDGGTVYLTRYGRRLAALVPAEVGEQLERSEDEYWSGRARAALRSEGPSVPWTEVVAELEQG